MFSRRLQVDLSANRLLAAADERRRQGAPILDLTQSNPTLSGLTPQADALTHALSDPRALSYHPDPHGMLPAREAVAGYYRERGLPTDPEALFLTASTSEAYANLFKLLADPGARILVPQPSYPLLDMLAALDSVELARYPAQYDPHAGWQIDLDELERLAGSGVSALVVVNPNNPTGAYLKPAELDRLLQVCTDKSLALIADEVFFDFPASLGGRLPAGLGEPGEVLTFLISGLSKVLGLPQIKLAWTRVSGPPVLARKAIERLEFIADAYLSVSTPAQLVAEQLLAQRGDWQTRTCMRLAANESELRSALGELHSCDLLKREGGWYAVLRLAEGISDEELAYQLLTEDGVLVHPGYFYDFPAGEYLVISLVTPSRDLAEGASRIARRLSETLRPNPG